MSDQEKDRLTGGRRSRSMGRTIKWILLGGTAACAVTVVVMFIILFATRASSGTASSCSASTTASGGTCPSDDNPMSCSPLSAGRAQALFAAVQSALGGNFTALTISLNTLSNNIDSDFSTANGVLNSLFTLATNTQISLGILTPSMASIAVGVNNANNGLNGVNTTVNAILQLVNGSAPTAPVVPPSGCEAWYVPPVDTPKNPAPGYLPFNPGNCPTSNASSLCAAGVTKDPTLQGGTCCQTSLGLAIIAQYWGPGLCGPLPEITGRGEICSCSYKQQMRRSGVALTLHGLWRDFCDGTFPSAATLYTTLQARSLSNVDVKQIMDNDPELYQAMRVYWGNYIPNVTIANDPYTANAITDLWTHEYNAHGVIDNTLWPGAGCYPSNTVPDRINKARDFFRMALRAHRYWDFVEIMKANGIVPSNTYYNATTFLATVDSATGLSTQISCYIAPGNIGVVYEIRSTMQVTNTLTFLPTPKIASPHRCVGATQIYFAPIETLTLLNSILPASIASAEVTTPEDLSQAVADQLNQ